MPRGLAAALAATSLISATAAIAAPVGPAASHLSITNSAARAGAPVSGRVSNQEGGAGALIGIGVIAAIVGIFLVLAESDNNDNPVSA